MLRGNVVAHVNGIAESIEMVIRSTTEIGTGTATATATGIVGIDDAA
jgi:hypothetical protein